MTHRIGRTLTVALATATLAAGVGSPALAAEPSTCDEVTAALVADQATAKKDASAVRRDTAAVKQARAAVKKAAKQSAAKRRSARAKLRTAEQKLTRTKQKQAADKRTLQRHRELSATLCTPGY